MRVDFLSQAGKLLKKQKQYRHQLVVFLCLAVIVTFGTVTALKLYGQAMTHKREVFDCQYEVHEHTDECYEQDEEGNLGTEPVCGYAGMRSMQFTYITICVMTETATWSAVWRSMNSMSIRKSVMRLRWC